MQAILINWYCSMSVVSILVFHLYYLAAWQILLFTKTASQFFEAHLIARPNNMIRSDKVCSLCLRSVCFNNVLALSLTERLLVWIFRRTTWRMLQLRRLAYILWNIHCFLCQIYRLQHNSSSNSLNRSDKHEHSGGLNFNSLTVKNSNTLWDRLNFLQNRRYFKRLLLWFRNDSKLSWKN